MSGSDVSSFKTRLEAQSSDLGLDITRTAKNVNYLTNFTAYLSILILIFTLQVFLARKIFRKIWPSLYQINRHISKRVLKEVQNT